MCMGFYFPCCRCQIQVNLIDDLGRSSNNGEEVEKLGMCKNIFFPRTRNVTLWCHWI